MQILREETCHFELCVLNFAFCIEVWPIFQRAKLSRFGEFLCQARKGDGGRAYVFIFHFCSKPSLVMAPLGTGTPTSRILLLKQTSFFTFLKYREASIKAASFTPVSHSHLFKHEHQVFRRGVSFGPRGKRTSPQPADGSVMDADPALVSGQ